MTLHVMQAYSSFFAASHLMHWLLLTRIHASYNSDMLVEESLLFLQCVAQVLVSEHSEAVSLVSFRLMLMIVVLS